MKVITSVMIFGTVAKNNHNQIEIKNVVKFQNIKN